MNFKTFMTKLLPSFGKRTLITELDQINDKLKTFTIPAYSNLGKSPFDSEVARYYEGLYSQLVTRGNMYTGISKALETCLELCAYIENEVDKKFNDDITRASLTAYSINMLKLVNTIDFVSDYARRLCLYLTTTTLNKVMGRPEAEGIVKAEQEFIANYRHAFFDSLVILNKSAKDIETKLESIPDIMVSPDNIDSVGSAIGKGKVDPLGLNFIAPRNNPAMFFVNKIARYQANRYEQAKVDLQEIQCKLLKLKQLKTGNENAKLDAQIEYYANLNDHVKAKIAEMEDDYDIS